MSWESPQPVQGQVSNALTFLLQQKGKEILTDNNIPHGQCVICLYGFQVGMCVPALPAG